MKTIFFSGSSTMQYYQLANDVLFILDKFADQKILVGDCKGADLIVQKYYCRMKTNVTVHCSGLHPRNNIAFPYQSWAGSSKGLKDREFHEVKDIKMTEACDIGVIFWDGRSKGSLNNLNRLKSLGKPYLLYNFYEKTYTYSDNFPEEFKVH